MGRAAAAADFAVTEISFARCLLASRRRDASAKGDGPDGPAARPGRARSADMYADPPTRSPGFPHAIGRVRATGRSSDSRARPASCRTPTGRRFPDPRSGSSAYDGGRSHSPLRGSPGFPPGSLLRRACLADRANQRTGQVRGRATSRAPLFTCRDMTWDTGPVPRRSPGPARNARNEGGESGARAKSAGSRRTPSERRNVTVRPGTAIGPSQDPPIAGRPAQLTAGVPIPTSPGPNSRPHGERTKADFMAAKAEFEAAGDRAVAVRRALLADGYTLPTAPATAQQS